MRIGQIIHGAPFQNWREQKLVVGFKKHCMIDCVKSFEQVQRNLDLSLRGCFLIKATGFLDYFNAKCCGDAAQFTETILVIGLAQMVSETWK